MDKLDGKTAAIIVTNEFEDVELLYPSNRLSGERARIVIVPVRGVLHPKSAAEKPVSGRHGTRFRWRFSRREEVCTLKTGGLRARED